MSADGQNIDTYLEWDSFRFKDDSHKDTPSVQNFILWDCAVGL